MAKVREPVSVEGAVGLAMAVLGADVAADVIGKSESYLRKYSDPDLDGFNIQVRQAIALDNACILESGIRPFTQLMRRVTDDALDRIESSGTPTEALMAIVGQLGEISRAVQEAQEPTGSGGVEITTSERSRIHKAISELRAQIRELERSIGGNVRSIAG